ncbi:hypothetical protein LCGC14_2320670 [marine sediment metagenome]|uniref:Uncharacterized protein n=1 Tax=marine sediment metagenome TaxID=412755 RepID=A0A0F9FCR7_9ZZZZ
MPPKKNALARFPQYLSDQFILSAANTFTTEVIFSPLPRFPFNLKSGETTAIEILWFDTNVTATDMNVALDNVGFAFSLGAPPSALPNLGNPLTMIAESIDVGGVATATGTALTIFRSQKRFDLQDKDGNGFLMASSRFNISMVAIGQATATILDWRMYYRFVIVEAVDLIGTIQSQVPI